MASTPSASALSAVLRCQGNIWTRNPPTKRPATSAYSLGLAGGALRDSRAERNPSNQQSAWEAFLSGGRVIITGGGLTVAYDSSQVHGWSTVRSTYLSLTALVSEFMFLRLVMLWRCSSSSSSSSGSGGGSADAPQHLQCPQKHRAVRNYVLQTNGQIHSPTSSRDNSTCGQKITEDRPD